MKLLPVVILAVCLSFGCDSLRGPTGDTGPSGTKGETGTAGDSGENGETGLQGDQGEKGNTGLQGDQGIQGENGETGLQGDQGIQGEKGYTGLQGDQGLHGDQGDTGQTGLKGDQGEQGFPGKDFEFTVFEGTLAPGDPDYWVLDTDLVLDKCIISVRVSGYTAFTPYRYEPDWYFKGDSIYIINDYLTSSGYRYIIIIASDHSGQI